MATDGRQIPQLTEDDADATAGVVVTALAAFDRLVAQSKGFRPRAGQREMAARIAHSLAQIQWPAGDEPAPQAIEVIQAGTGVGKSAAYLAPCLALAQARNTRVVVSTATVALQEQLMGKDLPALAATWPQPFHYALAKGRGRYVCAVKLHRAMAQGVELDLGLEEPPGVGMERMRPAAAGGAAKHQTLIQTWVQSLAQGAWNGDRDALVEAPDAAVWSAVAADRHSCTGRHCPSFRGCSYFQARQQLAQANVIVANHDLVLASLGRNALPELEQGIWVFDEGHHLPAVALAQFAARADLTSQRWLERLPPTLADVAQHTGAVPSADANHLALALREAMADLVRMAVDVVPPPKAGATTRHRFAQGQIPADWVAPVQQLWARAKALLALLDEVGAEIKQRAKDDPALSHAMTQQYARLGQWVPRLGGLVDTAGLWLAQDAPPHAKWLLAEASSGFLGLGMHASPLAAGPLLQAQVWSRLRAGVVTSATLSSCGSFDYFLAESGLQGLDPVQTCVVDSPFDPATQGALEVVETASDPRDVAAFTQESLQLLWTDLADVQRGALVLFTSRAQMQAAVAGLPASLLEVVRVQGTQSRTRLVAAHQARVESGQPAILFGLQSFGGGLDLPGSLCETLFITKLPFQSPTDPVEEARAEWLRAEGRDPFAHWVVPATGIRLLQWTGRAIRTETDVARIVCYDKRLLGTSYGRHLLKGLPPYALFHRVGGQRRRVTV